MSWQYLQIQADLLASRDSPAQRLSSSSSEGTLRLQPRIKIRLAVDLRSGFETASICDLNHHDREIIFDRHAVSEPIKSK